MSQDLFREVAEPPARQLGARRGPLMVSLVAHAAGVTALVIVPLVATDVLPVPFVAIGPFEVKAEPPPPPAAPAESRPPADASADEPAVNPNAAPAEAPDRIVAESDPPPLYGARDLLVPRGRGIAAGLAGSVGVMGVPSPPPSMPPRPSEPLRAGHGVRMPVKIIDVMPSYPRLARNARVDGTVIIEATIGTDGLVRDARVLRSVALLDQAALDAVRQWQYRPTLLNGVPVPVIVTVTVTFRLQP